MKLSEKQMIFTRNIGCLISEAHINNIGLTFGEAHRTRSQQLLYFFGFKIEKKDNLLQFIKDKRLSWTLNSKHLKRLAVDFNFFVDGRLVYEGEDVEYLGRYWECLHESNVWGGRWENKDTPHFEMK